MPSRRERLKDLFWAARDLNPESRAVFLDSECGLDTDLRQQVEALVEADADAGSFLEYPTGDVRRILTAPPNTLIGPYQLLELIGEGGMGQVWLAEQKQPVRRRVAIKLIKAGMDTREVVARFASERQALALMDHPAIAKVFDAGSTADGRPYFVMEYVAGIPITTYCDRHRLTVRQRMELFVQVCEGVHHAHQKAIIHRDLKPSNILVAEVDGKPRPRIIDFGVAKATTQKLTPATLYTHVGVLIGTLGYMSPEQADPVGEDIDCRTDVYSLGVVLFELLTGTLPFDLRKLPYDQALRRLREEDAPRPSTRLGTLGSGSGVAAGNRGSEPPTLVRQLRGDPDAIALKALEKNRSRRYASAADLAADILRYLNNQPVTAHPPSPAYRLSKYVRRRSFETAVVAVALLVIALLATWWRGPAAVPVVESIVQLTDDGQPKGAMVSNGSRIYFQTGGFGSFRVGQVAVTGGPTAPLETGFANYYLKSITGDGSALLAAVPGAAGPNFPAPLWSLPLAGGTPKPLGNIVINLDDAAALLPDGRIVFPKFLQGTDAVGIGDRTDWYIAANDGSNLRKLLSLPGAPGDVAVSPDGRHIVFTQEQVNDRRLFKIAPDGTGLLEIAKLRDDECCFIFTADQRYLAFQGGNSSRSDIWLLPLQTGFFRHPGAPIRLTSGPLPYSLPYPGRDGKQIFILGTKERGEVVRFDMNSHQFVPILPGISATDVNFSRDGKWLAYASYPDHTLWRSRGDGSEREQLTGPPLDVRYPAISPDGSRIAFYNDKNEIFVIDASSRTPKKVADNGIFANWSPDGQKLLYRSASYPTQLLILDLRTGQRSALPSSDSLSAGFWLNQDSVIVPNRKLTNFLVFNLKTGKWTEFAQEVTNRMIVNWMISPDNKYMYVVTGGAEAEVKRLRLADQHLETITVLKDLHRAINLGTTQINVAPDGSPIFTRDIGYQEIYALNIRWP